MPRLPPTLTWRQWEALKAIRRLTARLGHSPSLTEIGDELGVNRSSAHLLVKALVERGVVVHRPGVARTIAVRPVAVAVEPRAR